MCTYFEWTGAAKVLKWKWMKREAKKLAMKLETTFIEAQRATWPDANSLTCRSLIWIGRNLWIMNKNFGREPRRIPVVDARPWPTRSARHRKIFSSKRMSKRIPIPPLVNEYLRQHEPNCRHDIDSAEMAHFYWTAPRRLSRLSFAMWQFGLHCCCDAQPIVPKRPKQDE
jgi:hypothetical protein